MKVFLGILIISFAIFHEIVVAGRSGGRGGPRFHSNMCCNVEKSERDSASQGEMIGHFKQCADELGLNKEGEGEGEGEGEERRKKDHGKMICMSECVGKKMNILDANSNLNEEEFTNFIKTKIALGDHQIAVADDVVKKCIDEMKTSTDESKGDGKCSPIAMKGKFCVSREFFKACPADKQDQSEQCLKLREHINSGNFPHRKGPRPGSAESDD